MPIWLQELIAMVATLLGMFLGFAVYAVVITRRRKRERGHQ